jgi:phenylacetate-CoA ligase
MYKQMMKDEFDIIHAVGIRSFQAFIAAVVSKRKKIPLVISDQGGLTTHPDLKESSFGKKVLIRLQQPLIKLIVNQSSSVIVPNEYEKKIFLNFCDESKISIVKNGIDVDEMRSWDSNFVKKFTNNEEFILFLGRFHEVKGIDTLLEAVNLIKKKLSLEKIKILIMGVDFGYEERMEKIIRKFDLFDNICIIKKPTRKDVISAYNTCKFLVLPSKWELSPLTPLEGFACKKTLISTTAHGIPYTISHNENCILVPPSDPLNLSKAILELIRNPQKCKQLGESGFRMVINEGNLETMSTNIFSVYEKTIKLNKGN